MKCCYENEIDVNDIFLSDQITSMQQCHSNESYAAICKQDSVIKNKLNKVSANKTVNKKGIYISRKHSFNSFEQSSLKETKTCIKEDTKPWITKHTSMKNHTTMKNHLRRFTNFKPRLIKLILIKNTYSAYSTNHLFVLHARKDHIQPQAPREKFIITTVLSAAPVSNKNLTF